MKVRSSLTKSSNTSTQPSTAGISKMNPHWLSILALLLCTLLSLALKEKCRCSPQQGKNPLFCKNGNKNSNSPNSGLPKAHYHEDRDITGDCLPDVGENEMKCFKWRSIQCNDGEQCELSSRNDDTAEIAVANGKATLLSPNFKNTARKSDRERYLCIYNVSLSCPGNAVTIEKINPLTTWPTKPRECQNYMAFYNDRYSSQYEHRYCERDEIFSRRLESSSFLAVMWNSDPMFRNKGKFEFLATCAPDVPRSQGTESQVTGSDPTEQATTGSGEAILNSLQDIII